MTATLQPIDDKENFKDHGASSLPVCDSGFVPHQVSTVSVRRLRMPYDIELPILPKLPPTYEQCLCPLLMQKLELCTVLCDFMNPQADQKAKIIKSETLKELMAFTGLVHNVKSLPVQIMDKFFEVFEINLFADFPAIRKEILCSQDYNHPNDVDYPHVSLTYYILINILKNDPQNEHFGKDFMKKILVLFQTPDLAEQKLLFKLLNSYLNALPYMRAKLHKELSFLLQNYKENPLNPYQISNILSFLKNEFTDPSTYFSLSNEILQVSILPLINTPYMDIFFKNLLELFEFFIEMDSSVTFQILQSVIKYWPQSNSTNQKLYLKILDVILSKVNYKKIEECVKSILKVIEKSLRLDSSKFVIEAALQILNNPKNSVFLKQVSKLSYPQILPYIIKLSKIYYDLNIRSEAQRTLATFHNYDPFSYDEFSKMRKTCSVGVSNERPQTPSGFSNWFNIITCASNNDETIETENIYSTLKCVYPSSFLLLEEKKSDKPGIKIVVRPLKRRSSIKI